MRKIGSYTLPGTLITNRCVLRSVKNDRDFEKLAEFFNDHAQAFPKWAHNTDHYDPGFTTDLMRYLYRPKPGKQHHEYYIFKKGSGDILGSIGAYLDKDQNLRFGYYIKPSMRQKGIGAETHAAVTREAFKSNKGLKGIWAEIEPHNSASKYLLMKNGFKPVSMRQSTIPQKQDQYLAMVYPRPSVL